jgi:hypothetical protein
MGDKGDDVLDVIVGESSQDQTLRPDWQCHISVSYLPDAGQ